MPGARDDIGDRPDLDNAAGVHHGDTIGGFPAERPVSPGDIVATVFQSLGLDHASHLQGPAGRPFALTDFGTEPIKELFA